MHYNQNNILEETPNIMNLVNINNQYNNNQNNVIQFNNSSNGSLIDYTKVNNDQGIFMGDDTG
jgi:hypothetical protein